MEKRGKFDYILLETSGLADPGPIASMFWLDDGLGSEIYLDGIVTLVDAKHIREFLGEEKNDVMINEAAKQIAIADRVIINKKDLVNEQEMALIREDIQEINSVADLLETQRSKIPIDFVLDIHAYDVHNPDALAQQTKKIEDLSSEHAHHLGHGVQTIAIHFDDQLETIDQLESWIQSLLWEKVTPGSEGEGDSVIVLRLKGLVRPPKNTGDERKRLVIQGVQDLYDIQDGYAHEAVNDSASKLVFIGKNLNKDKLIASLKDWLHIQSVY
ncbi:CobW/HypB/UreG, nucleotide-binding domain-containing protein [Dichotomocladium elegans]|nr:CobW/HypB/UreG, nucleotide-binding domain-containing protein [Dichotomocladium elegans]